MFANLVHLLHSLKMKNLIAKKLLLGITLLFATQIQAIFLGRQVGVGSDDVSRKWTGSAWDWYLNGTAIYVGYWASTGFKCGGGMRWTNITILGSAIIDSAFIKVYAYQNLSYKTVNSKIQGEDTANATTFTATDDYLDRNKTTAVVNWNSVEAFVDANWYQSPDIKTVVQEIVNRNDWASGNAMVIFWQDFDNLSTQIANVCRQYRTREWSAALGCSLKIYYSEPPPAGFQGQVILIDTGD